MEVRQVIPNLAGGLSTLPSLDRNPTEVPDSWNMLFSNTHGAYKRPGTETVGGKFVLNPGCKILNGRPVDVTDPKDPRYTGRYFATFFISPTVYQFLMVGSGVWETGWVDLSNDSHTNSVTKTGNELLKVTPEGTPIEQFTNTDAPMLRGMNEYFIYDEDPDGRIPHPREVFRATRIGGRIFVVNNRRRVQFTRQVGQYEETSDRRGIDILHKNHYQILFYAITSGQAVKINLSWIANWGDTNYRKYDWVFTMSNLNIETIAEQFVETWENSSYSLKELFIVSGLQRTAAIRVKELATSKNLVQEDESYYENTGTNLSPDKGDEITLVTTNPPADAMIKVSNVKFSFTNVAAHVLDSTVSGGNQIPSTQARPITSVDQWNLKITGGTADSSDDIWIKFQGDK